MACPLFVFKNRKGGDADMKTPEKFYETYVGKSIDFDNYAGVQ